jgi:hypothetical protein
MWRIALTMAAGSMGSAAFAQELGFLDREALILGRAIMGLAFFATWFWAGVKAAEAGHNWLAWVIVLAPVLIIVLGLMGAFR